jgi:hypothetical protein
MQIQIVTAARFPADVPRPCRLVLLYRMAATNRAEIERDGGVARGAVSNYEGGRVYLYPKLRRAIVGHLAERLQAAEADVDAYLFGDDTARSMS